MDVERDVRLLADDPAVVARGDGEDVAAAHLAFVAVAGDESASLEHDAHVLALAARVRPVSDVLAPTPAGLIDGAPELHARDRDHLEAPHRELARLIRLIEATDDELVAQAR